MVVLVLSGFLKIKKCGPYVKGIGSRYKGYFQWINLICGQKTKNVVTVLLPLVSLLVLVHVATRKAP